MMCTLCSTAVCTDLAHSCPSFDDLPNHALDLIFSFTDTRSYVSICCVCKRWNYVFAQSLTALPHLKLSIPLKSKWLQTYSLRLLQLTLRRVNDLSWISSCGSLQSLWIEDARHLDDISPLSSLPCLSTLTLTNCRTARNLSPLRNIPQLTALTIDRCFARDLAPLSGHAKLQSLHLAYDCWSVMGLQLPRSLPALRRMHIMSAVHDLTPVACFTSLQELEVYAVSVYDLSPLSNLTNLKELDLHHVQDEDLHVGLMSPLSALTGLQSLGLQGCDASIVDLTPWHCLLGLTRVDLHGSCVSDLSPLQVVSGLQALDLTEARELVDVSPLRVLTNLSELVLTGCRKVRDLRPVLHIMAAGGLRKP